MTDNELIRYFKSLNGPTCGRFTESQLNRDIPLPKKPLPWVKYFFKFSLPAFLLSFKSSVQGQKISYPIEIAPVTTKAGVVDTLGNLPITGVVSDEGGVPLAGATVLIKGTQKGTLTDVQGRFVFSDIDSSATLIISYVGYLSTEVKMSPGKQGTDVRLQLTPILMGEVVVVGYISPKKTKRSRGNAEPGSGRGL
jgi:hypothetical protein